MLDKIDAWIDAGVLGGEEPSAADFQIAPSIRLLGSLDDLNPAITSRPAGRLSVRIVERFPGRVRVGAIPREWIPDGLAASTAERALQPESRGP
jgi:glutathione S-transferase